MTPQELKSSILQLAIQGKLVEQRPEEGTAEELYQQIQTEKQRLIKEGKIKKEKSLPEISEGEVPFEIPDSWKWVHIRDITLLNPKNDLEDDLEVSFIPMALVSDGFQNSHTHEIRQWKEIKKGFTHFADGDIGIAKITPCFQNRKSVIFSELKNGCGAGTTELSIVRVISNLLLREYLLYFFKSAYFIENGIKSFTGTAGQQRIHKNYLPLCLFPLPPLAEQKRIVAKIEELLPLVDRYEQVWDRLEAFNRRFPLDMQKSLLQWAIQGKLVEQRPEEGTAEELYQQIQAEKRRLVKEGKIKKEKPMPEIAEDEVPFEIPMSWKWVRFLSVVNIATNLAQPSQHLEYMHIAPDNIEKATGHLLECHTVKEDKVTSANHLFREGQIIYSKIRPLLRKTVIAPFDGLCSADMYPLVTTLDTKYVLYYMLSDGFNTQVAEVMSSRVKMPKINQNELMQVLLPLPPLAEQKRIVAKLEDLLPLCERLK